jgi:ubiquinone/menaquinone biosynthesis C-methylase UbiE
MRTKQLSQHQELYASAIRRAKLAGLNEFHAWFNKSESLEQSVIRGYWDFALHILTSTVCRHLSKPEEKTCLEIGYGGGRVLNAACSYFTQAIGIDIHDEAETVAKFLRDQGKQNFRLIKTPGNTIEVENESIDFVYSIIVLQHLPSFSIFVDYIKETYRCLKQGGIAQLYFGRLSIPLTQFWRRWQGYKEIPTAPVNRISLLIHPTKAKAICQSKGFKIISTGTSYKRVPDGYPNVKGGQDFVTLLK